MAVEQSGLIENICFSPRAWVTEHRFCSILGIVEHSSKLCPFPFSLWYISEIRCVADTVGNQGSPQALSTIPMCLSPGCTVLLPIMALWLFFTGPSSGCWRALPKYDIWKCLELSIPPTLTSLSAQSDLSQWPTRMGVWKSSLFALGWDDFEVYLIHQSSPLDQRRLLSMTLPTYPSHLASPLSYPLHFLVCFFWEFLEKSTCTQILMSECTSEDLGPRLSAPFPPLSLNANHHLLHYTTGASIILFLRFFCHQSYHMTVTWVTLFHGCHSHGSLFSAIEERLLCNWLRVSSL